VARNYLWTISRERKTLTSLTLNDVTEAHAGEYKCTADNSAGRAEVSYRLWMTQPYGITAVTDFIIMSFVIHVINIGLAYIDLLNICLSPLTPKIQGIKSKALPLLHLNEWRGLVSMAPALIYSKINRNSC